MNAMIRLGNGEYYRSAVFGYYDDNANKDTYSYDGYYIVFNKEKTALIKQPLFNPTSRPTLDRMVLIHDENMADWIVDESGYGGVDFLPQDKALQMIEHGVMQEDLLQRCIQIDSEVEYKEYNEINTDEDITKLMMISGEFHDAVISKIEERQDETLTVLFVGIWGCSIEVFFKGDVSYSVASRNPDIYDPYWFEASVIIKDGYVYFIDADDILLDDINDKYCWFKARSMLYHVIPN